MGSDFLEGFIDFAAQFCVIHRDRKLRKFTNDVFRGVEKNTGVGFAQHGGIVVGITGGDHLEIKLFQPDDGLTLLIRHAQMVIDQHAGAVSFEGMAEQGGPAQLTHQRMGKFVEGVGKNEQLVALAQGIEKFAGARHRTHVGNHFLDIGQSEIVLTQDIQTVGHQLVVIRLIARGAAQFGDASALGKFDPDFGNQNALKVETDDLHGYFLYEQDKGGILPHQTGESLSKHQLHSDRIPDITATAMAMIKKIGIDQLKPGMYVHDLNCGWLDHPFLKSSFFVSKEETIEKIRRIGVRELYIDTIKGADFFPARTQEEVSEELDRRLQELAQEKTEVPVTAALAEESSRARRLHGEANRIVRHMMEDVRMGAQIEIERVEPMVENMVDSIFRNQDALLPLSRLRTHDNYTFEHSVSVCTLLVAFGRAMNLPRAAIKEMGMGGLLHDVGKARVPDAILNKPGKLTDSEFDRMREHVNDSVALLKATENISDIALRVAAEHHERFDGSGYPGHLPGKEISLYGQMAAIVDVYDAVSSERVYHKGLPPTQVLKKLLEWSAHHFDPQLVQAFIRTVGIYPSGALVRLESGRLGVVIEQNEGNLLEPVVRVFYRADKQYYIPPEIINLSKTQDRVASFETYEKWNIEPQIWLPG